MNAVAEILRGLEAAGNEWLSCLAKLDEVDAIRAVNASGLVAYQVDSQWIVAPYLPAGYIGWSIEKSWKGHATKWWIEGSAHYSHKPRQMDDFAKSIYADHAAGYSLD